MIKVGLSEELPLTLFPDEPYWSENYYFVGTDQVSFCSAEPSGRKSYRFLLSTT